MSFYGGLSRKGPGKLNIGGKFGAKPEPPKPVPKGPAKSAAPKEEPKPEPKQEASNTVVIETSGQSGTTVLDGQPIQLDLQVDGQGGATTTTTQKVTTSTGGDGSTVTTKKVTTTTKKTTTTTGGGGQQIIVQETPGEVIQQSTQLVQQSQPGDKNIQQTTKVVKQGGQTTTVTETRTQQISSQPGQQQEIQFQVQPGGGQQTITETRTQQISSQPGQQQEIQFQAQPGGGQQTIVIETQPGTQTQQIIEYQSQPQAQPQPQGQPQQQIQTQTQVQQQNQQIIEQQIIQQQQQQQFQPPPQQPQQQQVIQQQTTQQVFQQQQPYQQPGGQPGMDQSTIIMDVNAPGSQNIQVIPTGQDPNAPPPGMVPVGQETDADGNKTLIFSGEYTKAMEQDWHSGHFACANCDMSLTGHRYILREEKPYCIKCYENLFANQCEGCRTPIGTDSKDLSYKDKHWHELCFKCCDCQKSLVDQPFASRDERLYCADCHDNNFAARCDGCQDIFRAGMKKFEYKGKQWHEQCFCCKLCVQPIGNKSFIPRDQEVVCVPCYEESYAQRCMKCNGVINKGGITYKGTPWHRDCFTCNNCNKVLAGEKFTSKEDKPYCADCFGDLFAKKCCRCTKPITGLGGTKFISFEERHWHSDCFVCYKCNASLVGRGFLTDATDILCPDCGRA